jgi:hypothetical protein
LPVQTRCACGALHTVVIGPPGHSPSPSPSASTQGPVNPLSSKQTLGREGSPRREQNPPPGHAELLTHGAPALLPLRQRRPPQIPAAPPLAGQSALEEHGCASELLHVSQRQRPAPGDPHRGLSSLSVFVTVEVELEASMGNAATSDGADGGQSKLAAPKSGRLGTVALASHARPSRAPPEQVPPWTSSLSVPSPLHIAHGVSIDNPTYTRDVSIDERCMAPLPRLNVPEIGPWN